MVYSCNLNISTKTIQAEIAEEVVFFSLSLFYGSCLDQKHL